MSLPARILTLTVIGGLVSLGVLVSRSEQLTPRQVLLQVEAEMQAESFDEQALLRRLASSLRRAERGDQEHEATRELCANLRMARGQLYLAIGATREARQDFVKVLDKYRPGDRDVRLLLIKSESAGGNVSGALGLLDALLKDEPDFGLAMVERGHLQTKLAVEALETCDEKLRFALIEADAEKASLIVHSLAARDSSDPGRAKIILKLKNLFPPSADESLGQVLGFSEEASDYLAGSRKAYVRSFGFGLDSVALTRYLKILQDAGRTQEALQLGGLIALQSPNSADPESALILLQMHMERGDYKHAAQLAKIWVGTKQPLNATFLRLSCEALYRSREWSILTKASARLRSIGSLEDDAISEFYNGMAGSQGKKSRNDRSLNSLIEFANARTPEPFPGARDSAWRTVAKLQKERDQLSREREAIQAALALKPANAGNLWLRRAEIQLETPNNGYRLPLESWTEGMSLLPRRTDELMERFVELGEQTLKAEERNLDVIFEDLQRSNQRFPTRDYGPYVLYRIAEMHGQNDSPGGQLSAASRLIAKFKDFVPALDLMIDARNSLGDREGYIELVIERIELAGMSPRSEKLLESIRLDELDNKQLVQMMMADPRGTGRMAVTKWFYANGENSSALETLESSTRASRNDDERIFGARILMADGDYRTALRWLDEVGDGPFGNIKARLAISCAMGMDKTEELLSRLRTLLENHSVGPAEMLLLADGCLREQQELAAKTLLGRLDPSQLEDPGILLRREVLLALRGDTGQASATVERAGSFLEDDEYLVSRLLLDGLRADWSRARKDALELAQTTSARTPLLGSLIDLLSDQEERAYENTKFGLSLTPLTPKWIIANNIARQALGLEVECPPAFGSRGRHELDALLNGRGSVIIDPRAVTVLLIASEYKTFEPYVTGVLTDMKSADRGIIWPSILKAELLASVGQELTAVDAYEKILATNGDCLPAWDGLEQIQIKNYGSSEHSQVARVRNRRLAALAIADPEGAAGLLIAAKRLRNQGDTKSALRLQLKAQGMAPDWYETRSAVARTYTDMGHWEAALEEWRGLVTDSDANQAARAITGYIRALGRASITVPPMIQMSQIKSELDRLNQSHPFNPRVVLALAKLDLLLDERNPAQGLDRAWSRLRNLRDFHGQRSLENVQRGATEAWANFYVETDPDSSEDFILTELQRQPGNLFLWRLLGKVQRELDKFDESIQVLTSVASMAPSSEAKIELAASYTAKGAAPSLVMRALQEAADLREDGESTLESQLIRAEALLNDYDKESWDSAILHLEAIYEQRHQFEGPEFSTKFASLYARALLLRGKPGDARRAVNTLAPELPKTRVPYQREQFHVLIGIGQSREPALQ
ncbi:MAG: tetratricopeptide (TPR) repeat protein [Planctomycetota bacterium]|jgi:tetratricopeptide (TPR) repeat protein